MRRREFIKLFGPAAIAWPLAAQAQQPEQVRLIGVLLPAKADDAVFQARLGVFLQELAILGGLSAAIRGSMSAGPRRTPVKSGDTRRN